MPPIARPLPGLDEGSGPAILLLHGFGMDPEAYRPTVELLARRTRVVAPDLFALPERWTYLHALDCLEATLDAAGLDRVTVLGHSFGGALELGFAARRPERVVECVFSDTLALDERLSLAIEAVHPLGIARMVTRRAIGAFVHTTATHPLQLARAALWAFAHDRDPEIDDIVRAGVPCHVLWAERDTILARADGQAFADRLHATFTVAERPAGYAPIDHDWMFDDPELFVAHLEALPLAAPVGRRS